MQSLDGQVAFVTGAARGIGFGIARVLAGEGAHVFIADIDAEAGQAAATQLGEDGLSAAATRMDVTDRDSVETAVRSALERWKRIDVLAANAGIYPHIPLDEISGRDWDRLMAINARGALFAIQACLSPMTTQRYGRIVLTSSITGSVVGQPGYAHYGASKAAMLGLMRSSALEVAAHGITINAVLPGNIRTPGFADLGREHERRMAAAIPMREFGDPEDVGWAVRFLASKEAKYITGQTLIIDGGQVLPESVLELDPEPST
jgi:3-oxoacyl-[acyl-carrier protein] reductase